MKAFSFTFCGLMLALSTTALARVGDAIQNNCSLSQVTEKTETALYDAVKLEYKTLKVTFNCAKDMNIDGDLVIKSPFTLVFNDTLKQNLQSIAQSKKSVPVVFVDEGYNIRPEQIANIKNFPEALAPARRLIGASTYAFENEAQYQVLDQVLDQAGRVRIPETQVNYRNPNDTRDSWKKLLHFVSAANDFEITIVQQGPFFFRAWQIPEVTVTMAYILTPSELSLGSESSHTLTVADSVALRNLLKASLISSTDFSTTQQIDCRSNSCTVKTIKNH